MSSLPTTLGQYQIIREIARSNDIVYEAYDPQMDRRVALKELNLPSGITDAQKQDRVHRFDREAKAAGRLAHPNIMRVFQVASDGERHYMAMEFLDGHTLRNEIDTKGFLPVDRAAEIATAVLKGLGHAHANGVVHRDIKPDNIQLLSSGEIKITDFGIARLTFQPNLTMDGQVFGTPSYMSPEQVVGKEIDARSDLFSVGVLLYEMINGGKPFPGDSVVAITYAIMNHEPEVLKQVNHSVWQVISRALDKSPALRFSSAQEMVDALDQAMKPSVVLDSPMAPPGQTIYGPTGSYPMPPPVLNPYGQPYTNTSAQMPPAIPPPIVYPYNPYQQPQGGMMAPHTSGFPQQGFPQGPVYYPPPPRQPLLKAETKHFIGKLFLTLVVMGTSFAVVILLVAAIGQAMSRAEQQKSDDKLVSKIESLIKGPGNLKARIEEVDPLIQNLKSPEYRSEQEKNLASLLEQYGQALMAKGPDSVAQAEAPFLRANELDKGNPKLMSDVAVLYTRFARARPRIEDRVSPYQMSAKWWSDAANASRDPQAQDSYFVAAAETYEALANELLAAGQAADADTIAKMGMGCAPLQSTVYRRLEALTVRIRESAPKG